MERNYQLEVGDVILVVEGGYGFCPEDISKYVEVIGFGDYFDDYGVRVKPYNCELASVAHGLDELGDYGCVGYESFGENPMILLNTKEQVKEKEASALDKQVSGNHYKDCGIQPIEYIHANGLDYFQGNVVKYVTRHKDKNGKADIEKAIHYLELILELQYGD